MSTESETRKEIIDLRLKEAGWDIYDHTKVIKEFFISRPSDGGTATPVEDQNPATYGSHEFSDYVLVGKNGKPLAVVEAKKSSKNAELGREQAKQYCHNIQRQQGGELPFCFYTNGHEIFKHGNPPGDFTKAPRCGAKNRRGTPCQCPAMWNGRCRLHGGLSTGAKTAEGLERTRRSVTKHGQYSRQRKLELRLFRTLLRQSREVIAVAKQV